MEYALIDKRIEALCLAATQTNSQPPLEGNSEFFYSLPGLDDEERKRLQDARLNYVVNQLCRERNDTTFSRDCLFCRKHFSGNRTALFDHLMEVHNLNLGNPDNIVFINELLDHLEQLLKEFKCFFCEKIFKDWDTLKEHMRKKQHKKLNPMDKRYDRFYLINYLEPGKRWVDLQEEDDGPNDNSMMEWKGEDPIYVCLFCGYKSDLEPLLLHMKESHGFDLKNLEQSHQLDFYKKIKLVNYIRKMVFEKICITCGKEFNFHEQLSQHFSESRHSATLPDPDLWDQPQYFFPTFESDTLLQVLDNSDREDE